MLTWQDLLRVLSRLDKLGYRMMGLYEHTCEDGSVEFRFVVDTGCDYSVMRMIAFGNALRLEEIIPPEAGDADKAARKRLSHSPKPKK